MPLVTVFGVQTFYLSAEGFVTAGSFLPCPCGSEAIERANREADTHFAVAAVAVITDPDSDGFQVAEVLTHHGHIPDWAWPSAFNP